MAWNLLDEQPNTQLLENDANPRERRLISCAGRVFGRKDAERIGTDGIRIHNPRGQVQLDRVVGDLILEGGRLLAKVDERRGGRWREFTGGIAKVDVASRSITMGGVEISVNIDGKWSFKVAPGRAGTFRLRVIVTPDVTGQVRLTERKPQRGGGVICARYPGFFFNWTDMADDVEAYTATPDELTLVSAPFVLAAGESKLFDPSVGPLSSAYNCDTDGSVKYPDDNSDIIGNYSSTIVRTVNRFTISSLDAADTVTQVDCTIYIQSVSSMSSEVVDVGPYNGDGQADPASDNASTLFSRCDVSSDNYVNDSTAYRSTGTVTHTDMGATAEADVEAARDAGTIFSLAWKRDDEGAAWGYADVQEDTQANPATLTITYTTGGGGLGIPIAMHHRKIQGVS